VSEWVRVVSYIELSPGGVVDAVDGGARQVDGRKSGNGARRLPVVPQLDAGQVVSGLRAAEQRQGDQRAAEGTEIERKASVRRADSGMVSRQR